MEIGRDNPWQSNAEPQYEVRSVNVNLMIGDGISRLFEMGRTIPQAASVSGHRSWQSLQRYTHLRETGDRFRDWDWRRHLMKKAPPERG